MSPKKIWTILTGIAVVIIVLLIPKWMPLLSAKDTISSSSGPRSQLVKTIIIKPKPFTESLTLNGSIVSENSVRIRSEIAGRIVDINFKEGENISAGTLLVKIDDRELVAQRKRIKSNLELAQIQENRQKRLLENGGSSEQNYDEARINKEALTAELELINTQISKTEIRAPFNGTLGLKNISVGTYLQPSQEILNIEQLDTLKVDFSVPERYLSQIDIGLPLTITTAGSDKEFSGKIIATDPRIDAGSRTLNVRGLILNPTRSLKPGAYAMVDCIVTRKDNAILIPSGAVIPSLTQQSVFLYKDGKAIERKVTTGSRTASETEILSGLEKGDELIVSGIQSLRPGLSVKKETQVEK